jgi:CHAT domain-containing protein/tetratricopeptide (TPR) repeat protein
VRKEAMTEKTPFDPNSTIPVEAFLGAPLSFIVECWKSTQPPSHVDPDLIARAPAILKAVGLLTSHPGINELQKAIMTHDEHALGALAQLADCIGKTCDVLLERCKQWKSKGQWTTLRHEAELAALLTTAVGRDDQRTIALLLLANAHRALWDNLGAIAAYEGAIQSAIAAGNEHLLSVAKDNLGNALADIGKFDEALECYEQAWQYELDPKGRYTILINKSNALRQLGELRSAAQIMQKALAGFEHAGISAGISDRDLAIALDETANPLAELGEPAVAQQMLEQARLRFPPEDLADRAINALSRSQVLLILGRNKDSTAAFVEAHKLAFDDAKRLIIPEHYQNGFNKSLAARLPPNHEANRLFFEGMKAKESGEWGQALNLWQMARNRSWKDGDHALALRIDANAVSLLLDVGNVKEALDIALRVRYQASELGLARPELMAISTIGTLAASGADTRMPLGPLGCFVMSKVLLEVHTGIVATSNLTPEEKKYESYDPGTISNELAIQAEIYHADTLAITYYRDAVNKARAVQGWFQLANRLAGLRSVLSRNGNVTEADTVAGEITTLLEKGVLEERGQLVAHRTLAFHVVDRNRSAAIKHLQQACELAETLRHRVRAGTERADVARQWPHLYHALARLLRLDGNDKASFEALQGEKARRLIDALSSLDTGATPVSDAPPKLDEIMGLINRMESKHPTFLVDLAVEEDGLTAYLVGNNRLQTIHISGNVSNLAGGVGGDVREREVRLVELCLRDPLLRDLAAAVTTVVPKKRARLLLVPDQFLHNLPLHLIPVEGQPLCDLYPIGYLPAAGALRSAHRQRPNAERSLVAGNSCGDLPYAEDECNDVANELGTKPPLLREKCTRSAIEEVLKEAGELDIVHLALHGRGDVRRGGRASLLLADGRGDAEWVDFEELTRFRWRVGLVVFSGCSTAVAGPRDGHELVGIARAAAERGAAAVIACLWPVGDEAAKIFMTAFYKELVARRKSGAVDLRLVFDEARKQLRAWRSATSTASARRRDGRFFRSKAMDGEEPPPADPEVVDALAWAPFILLGNPVLG